MLRRFWRFARNPSSRFSLGFLVGGGFVAGILFWGGFHWALELSNTETFCISCHEMRDSVFEELKETVHYTSASGVRATCPDCHVPKQWHYKIIRKMQASMNELPKHLLGFYDTPEKWEAHRPELAKHVWEVMKANDSRECRNCHHMDTMKLDAQRPRARSQHESAAAEGETCIDCHKGIAHKHFEQAEEAEPASGDDSGGFVLQ